MKRSFGTEPENYRRDQVLATVFQQRAANRRRRGGAGCGMKVARWAGGPLLLRGRWGPAGGPGLLKLMSVIRVGFGGVGGGRRSDSASDLRNI